MYDDLNAAASGSVVKAACLRIAHRTGAELAQRVCSPHVGECTGLLIGAQGLATGEIRLANMAALGGELRIEAADIARASRYAAGASLQIVALYHEHPGGILELSPADRDALALSPWPWLVVAGADEGLRLQAYQAGGGDPLRVCIEAT